MHIWFPCPNQFYFIYQITWRVGVDEKIAASLHCATKVMVYAITFVEDVHVIIIFSNCKCNYSMHFMNYCINQGAFCNFYK